MTILTQTKTKSKISTRLGLGVVAVVAIGATIIVGSSVISGGGLAAIIPYFPIINPPFPVFTTDDPIMVCGEQPINGIQETASISQAEICAGFRLNATDCQTYLNNLGTYRFIDPYKKNTAVQYKKWSTWYMSRASYEDKCNTDGSLQEGFCTTKKTPAGIFVSNRRFYCPNGCSNGACRVTQPNGQLKITRDINTPAAGLIAANSSQVTLAVFEAEASNEDIAVEKLYLSGEPVNNGGWDQISKVYLLYIDPAGNTITEQVVPTSTDDGQTRTVLFDLQNRPMVIKKNGGFAIVIKADTADSNFENSSLGTSGQGIKLKINSATDIYAKGVVSGTSISNIIINNAVGDSQYLFRSVPLVTQDTVGGQLIAGMEIEKNLYQFSVSANSSGDIGLYYVTFKLIPSDGVTIQNLKLYEGSTLIASKLVYQPAGDNMIIHDISVVPSGGTKNYSFKADVGCTGACLTNGRLIVSMLGDLQFPNTLPSTIPGLDPYSNFCWTDFWLNPTLGAGAPGATTTMAQWSSGYLVPLNIGGTMQPTSIPITFSR